MANVETGNTIFVDTAGTVTTAPTKLAYILLTSNAANAVLDLRDANGTRKLELRLAAAGETKEFSFEMLPIFFATGVMVASLTNAVATLVCERKGS